MANGDKSHDTKITSKGQVIAAVRSSSLGGSKKPEPQFGVTKMPKFGITQKIRGAGPWPS